MQCRHCNSEWKSKEDSSISVCPFCGKSLIEEGDSKFYENSKDALTAIMKRFGADILLGKLSAHFSDLAPQVPQSHKKLVYAVHENGASKVLKENMDGTQEDKESAVKLAVRKLTDAYIAEEAAETIIHEFAAALGWKVNRSKYNGTLTGKDDNGTTWTYTGDIQDGQPHGKGKRTYNNVEVYEGDWVEGKRTGKGKMTYKSGNAYEGDWVDGKYHGKGKYILAGGGGYEGDWIDNKRNGKGKLTRPDGTVLQEGRWENGEFVDQSSAQPQAQPAKNSGNLSGRDFSGTWTYTGDIQGGKRHGIGKCKWDSGVVYEGEFVDDKRHGKGKLLFSDGTVAKDGRWEKGEFMAQETKTTGTLTGELTNGGTWRYSGDVVNGQRHGKGKITYSDGSFYEGDWVKDKRHGKGKYSYYNAPPWSPNIYEGDWVNGDEHGKGKMTYGYGVFEGNVYIGDWANGKRNGEGTLFHRDGSVIHKGRWEDDKFVGEDYDYDDEDDEDEDDFDDYDDDDDNVKNEGMKYLITTQKMLAKEDGDADAAYRLAKMYEEGDGVEADEDKAFYWYKMAAQLDHDVAQNKIAKMYEEGDGVEADEDEAFYWHEKAAENDNIYSQRSMGYHCFDKKDYEKALYWYEKADEQGFPLDIEIEETKKLLKKQGK